VNDTYENLMASIAKGETEISPSSLYAVACIEEGVAFINGSPQNTFVPGVCAQGQQMSQIMYGP